MSSPSTSTAEAKKGAPTQRELLDALVGIVMKHVNEHFTGCITRMIAALQDVSDPSVDARAVHQRMKAGNVLKANSYAYFHLLSGGLEAALRKEIDILVPPMKQRLLAHAATLELVPFEEMDNKVTFSGIARPFEIKYADVLATMNVRLGFVLERDILRMTQNPFRPDLILAAVDRAWAEFEPDADSHPLMAPLLTPELLFDFGPMYEELNTALQRKGRQPGSVDAYKIRKTDHVAAKKAAAASTQAELAKQLRKLLGSAEPDQSGALPDLGIPLLPDLPQLPKGEGGWRPSAAGAAFQGAGAAPAGAAQPAFMAQPGFAGAAAQPHAAPGGGAPAQPYPGFAGAAPGGAMPTQSGFAGTGGGQAHPGFAGTLPPGWPTELHADASGVWRSTVTNQVIEKLPPGISAARVPLFAFLSSIQVPAAPGGAPARHDAGTGVPHGFHLPDLKATIPQGALSRGDETTIDLLARVFDTVFRDPNIPGEIRELINFLQIPVLKAALIDKNFFFQEAHPARRLIELLSKMGWEQRKAPDDPMFQAMRQSVDKVGRDFDAELAVFDQAVTELEARIAEQERSSEQAMAAPIAAALKQERAAVAAQSARKLVQVRLGGAGGVVAVVEGFLQNKWTSVLTLAYTIEEDKPGAVNNATKTMDDLIWSVKPKLTHEQRRDLIAKLPGLIVRLNKWLDVIKWKDAERLKFFAELAECHASIVRAPIDLSPERQLELAVEAAQQDAVRRIEQEQAVEAAEAEAQLDDHELAVDALERGMWMEFTQTNGAPRKVKLAWVSPRRTLFIFSTGAKEEAFSLAAEKLVGALRAGKATILGHEGLVGRALQEALGAAVNDPEHAAVA